VVVPAPEVQALVQSETGVDSFDQPWQLIKVDAVVVEL
jgi:hypothetical protein